MQYEMRLWLSVRMNRVSIELLLVAVMWLAFDEPTKKFVKALYNDKNV